MASNYWQKRALESRIATVNMAERSIAELGRSFARATSDMQAEAERILKSIDGDTAKARQKLASKELSKYRQQYGTLLDKYMGGDAHAKDALDLLYKQDSINRLDSMIGQVQMLTYDLYGKTSGSIEQAMTSAAERSYYGTFNAIETRLGKGYEWAHIDDKKLNVLLNSDWSGQNWSDRIWGHVSDFNDQLKDVITRGVLTGSSIDDMSSEIRGKTNVLKHQAERIVRTETAYVAGEATAMSYEEAGIDAYKYLATLDLRTSAICRSLDGKSFALEDKEVGVNYPPMHPNCRSTTYFSLGGDPGMRAARDPDTGKTVKVPADWDYDKWYQERVEKISTTDDTAKKIEPQTLSHNKNKPNKEQYARAVTSAKNKKTLSNEVVNGADGGIINNKSNDVASYGEKVYKSLGARTRNTPNAVNPFTGETFNYVSGARPKFPPDHTMAGKGCKTKRQIDDIDRLVKEYKEYDAYPEGWQKEKARYQVYDEYGEIREVEIHWYQHENVGRVEEKPKLDKNNRMYVDEWE